MIFTNRSQSLDTFLLLMLNEAYSSTNTLAKIPSPSHVAARATRNGN